MDLTDAVHRARDVPLPAPGTEVFAVVSTAFPAPLDVDLKSAPQEFQVALEGRQRDLQFPEEFLPRNYLSDLQHLLNSQNTFRLAHRTGHYIPLPHNGGRAYSTGCARARKRAVRPVSAGPSSTRKLLHTFADYSCLVAKDLPIPSENIAPAIQQGGPAERIF